MKRTTKQSHLLSLFIKPQARLLPRNDGILDGSLNEIASVALLTPRNDGDLMGLLRSLCSLAMTDFRNDGILDEILNEILNGILEFGILFARIS